MILNSSLTAGKSSTLFRITSLIPFVLGAALYLSAIFKFFAALPLVFAQLKFGRFWGTVCSLTNLALVWVVSGRSDAAWFFVIAVVFASTLAECIRLRLRTEFLVMMSIGMMLLASGLLLVSYSQRVKQNPVAIVKNYIDSKVDELSKNAEKFKASSTVSSQDLDRYLIDPEMTKRDLMESLPSITMISLLVLVVGNVLLMFRLNFCGVRQLLGVKADYFKRWKAPDRLVWPTIVSGFCILVEIPIVSEIALNIFKVLMAIYAIQGFAILSYFFDAFKLKGFLRPIAYILAVTFLIPFVISLGFFDLWTNFREKLRGDV